MIQSMRSRRSPSRRNRRRTRRAPRRGLNTVARIGLQGPVVTISLAGGDIKLVWRDNYAIATFMANGGHEKSISLMAGATASEFDLGFFLNKKGVQQ